MPGVPTRLSLAWLFIGLLPALATAEPSRVDFQFGADLTYIDASAHPSWTDGSAGKLRHGDDDFVLSRAFGEYSLRLGDTVSAHVAAEAYDDDIGSPLDLTEAYISWRPLTMTANRYRLKVGAFYPKLSLENTGPGWGSPYTLSSSAINTWIAEEIRVLGAEFSVSRRPASLGGAHTFTLAGTVFYSNDTSATLLVWKGWSIHDRQTRLGDELPLPPLPQLEPGGYYYMQQDPYTVPFIELDNDPGYFLSGEWRYGERLMLQLAHYDNKADLSARDGGQTGWYTEFNHVGLQATLPGDIGLIAQWMRGSTLWGPVIADTNVVDAEFDSYFVLLTRAMGRHRVSARYDDFGITENDQTPLDENAESGHAVTLAYLVDISDTVDIAAEWLSIHTERPAWAYYGLQPVRSERQFQLSVRFGFASE